MNATVIRKIPCPAGGFVVVFSKGGGIQSNKRFSNENHLEVFFQNLVANGNDLDKAYVAVAFESNLGA